MAKKEYDYVVVGGGSSGAVVAYRLAEAGKSVALLEAGPSDEGLPQVLEIKNWQSLLGSELDYDYTIEPQVRGNGLIRHSRAKVLGGCSSHNSCIAFVAPDYDFDRWVGQGAKGWEPHKIHPMFEKVKRKIHMETVPRTNELNEAFIAACESYGLPSVAFNQNYDLPVSAGYLELNVKGKYRVSSSVGYLHPIADLPKNLEIITETKAHQIKINGKGKAESVLTDKGEISAREEIILSCGAFDTPKLLQLSGIGPKKDLEAVGISTIHDLSGVGENLLDHPEGVIIFETNKRVPPALSQKYEAAAFLTTQPGETHPDLMYHFGLEAFDMNTRLMGYPTAENAFSLTPNVTRAKSQGVVKLRSKDPKDAPLIDFRYFTDPAGYDDKVMTAGIEIAREIVSQSPLKEWVKKELAPGNTVQSKSGISEYVRKTANTVYHPAGTCKMGEANDPNTVVDPELKVKGIEGLRIADASIFPSMVTVNPNITCMMIGEKCASMILEN